MRVARPAAFIARPEGQGSSAGEPLLEPGDRLSRDEFERRYARMPHLKKAELIEGTVYMPFPVRVKKHAVPHSRLAGWLVVYASEKGVLTALRRGLETPEHTAFAAD